MAALGEKKLYRSRENRVIAGVCGGLAEWLGWDPTVVRVLYVLLSVLSGAFPGILVYILLWVVMPERPEARAAGEQLPEVIEAERVPRAQVPREERPAPPPGPH